MNIIFFILISAALITGVEVIKRNFKLPTNITRRMSHIGGALITFTFPLFLNKEEIIFIGVFFAVILWLGRSTTFLSSIHNVERKTMGEVYLPLGIALCAMFFLPNDIRAFQYGILIMGLSDAFAGLMGENFSKYHFKIFGNKKSLEGSVVFFITSLILSFFFGLHFGYPLILISLCLTLVEFCLVYGLDNLVLPVLAAYFMHIFK